MLVRLLNGSSWEEGFVPLPELFLPVLFSRVIKKVVESEPSVSTDLI